MKKDVIYLRRLRWDEAELKLMKELDILYLKGIKKIKIVHGKGGGKLKEMVAAYLSRQPFVEGFEQAPYYEGGSGVTIVTFR
ncbi:MAG: Smr/MutS family protein [Spirochaetes bacterium]|nr:Smr/MutS family protein [Spirochaetota bacterium]